MGTRRGHVLYGIGFSLIGLWHIINNSKLQILNPKSFTFSTWFPTSRIRYLELLFMMAGCVASIAMELFVGLIHHKPLDVDGSIPSSHLHNFEHSIIAVGIFMYAVVAVLLDKLDPPAKYGLTNMVGSGAFGLELLIFHFHSADHMGIEGQYHWLLEIVIFISLSTTVLSIGYPESFLISFVRSISVLFQGVWFVNIGFMLCTPGFIAKGCFMNRELGHFVVRCNGEDALERAKSLVNIQFTYCVVGLCALAVTLYLFVFKIYSGEVIEFDYQSATTSFCGEHHDDDDDVEAEMKGFVKTVKPFVRVDMEM